jgi:two-component sensor histidine kinase
MAEDQFNLLEELESISKIHTLLREDIDAMMIDFAKRILGTLRIERMSVWLFNANKDAIVSIGEYDLPTRRFSKEKQLLKSKFPTYFKAISENEILLAEDVFTNPATLELNFAYSKPNNVISLMDIPLRIEGELIGVMCFEKTGKIPRRFNENEQTFALSLAIVFASNLEARQRRALQAKLDEELKEKTVLLKEIHHRVKNNISVVSSLVNLQSTKSKDDYHKALFAECINKINSIAGIHELIYKSKSLSEINANEHLSSLLENLKQFYHFEKSAIVLEYYIEDVFLDIEFALPLALIVNEVVTNAYKHAFKGKTEGRIKLSFTAEQSVMTLKISDNGQGFSDQENVQTSLGFDIISGLASQLDATYNYTTNEGVSFVLSFDTHQN